MWKIFFRERKFIKADVKEEYPKPGEVRVFPKYIGICGTDKNIYLGKKTIREPLVLGHEIAGITEDGEKVVVFPNYWCNYCINCRKGFYNSCKNKISIGVNADGGMAEWINVPKNFVFKLPNFIDLKIGALVEPTAVALSAINKIDRENIRRVIIIGGGSTGTLASIVSEIYGFKSVIIEKDKRKEKILKEKGFTVNDDEIIEERIAIIDTINNNESMMLAQSILKNSVARSELIITGLDEEYTSLNRDVIVRNEVVVKGSIIYSVADFLQSIKIVSENSEKFAKIIDKIGEVDQINEWFKRYVIEEPNVKVLVKID
ncbi:zinc-binding dehydrogenase [Sulfolobus tengchongensis]|uniref:Zinc-binding dehydrogenase n=1 Tax=Sulfolobus tengchongensis TaxID=207809 RepID=A0AAX4L3T7_9CREN